MYNIHIVVCIFTIHIWDHCSFFFQVSKVRTSGKNNADQRGRKTEGVVILQPSDLTSKLFVLLLHVQ